MEFGGVGVGGTGTGGASFVGAGAKGHDTRDTSSEGVGVEGVGARGASSKGALAEGAGSSGASSCGARFDDTSSGDAGARGAKSKELRARGTATAMSFQRLRQLEHEEWEWLEQESPCRSPPHSVLLSPSESSLIASTSTPITNYYHATCHVVTRVLASVVTNPRASPSSISALTATVSEYAATRHLVYATPVVAAHPLSTGGTYVNAIPPPGANVVDDMWLLKVKRPPGSSPVFKSRYMARGFSPRDRVDFFQNFAPTPKMTTLQVLLHVAAQRDYKLLFLNFSAAFLQGHLHEEIGL
ncbi:unnamed protein product [Closterium sp. NIES-54]